MNGAKKPASLMKMCIRDSRDAHAAGVIHAADPAAKARMVFAYYEGLLTQARIQNDAEVLREIASGMFAMLGVNEKEAVVA